MRTFAKGVVAATLVAVAFLAAGCTSTNSSGDSGGKVNLTFWSWSTNIDKTVAIWNKSHPNIQVRQIKIAQGDPSVTKLLAAAKAGSGLPDVTLAEYQTVPSLVANNVLADISKYVPSDLKNKYSQGDWSGATLGTKAVYGVPQDTGPMEFYYRKDVFDSLGLTPPKTWDDYAADAKKVHDANPGQYLGTFSSADAGQFKGLAQQAGASWWSVKGDKWAVKINDEATKKVADYWGGLVQSGVIDNQPQYTPEWNNALNTGGQVGWLGAAWSPGVLQGNAPDTAGKWAMAPLPQWNANDPATGTWGGSLNGVTTQSKHPKEAAEFVTWLDSSKEGVASLVKDGGLYPAATGVAAPALASAPAFFPGETDFWKRIGEINKTTKPFTYGPNVNVAYSAFNDDFGKAVETKTTAAFAQALDAMQTTTASDLKSQGFSK
jgi:multiple sugar transport system substrate-binding protein